MLRQTIILSSAFIAVVAAATMTGEVSPLTKAISWATTPAGGETGQVAAIGAPKTSTATSAGSGRQVSLQANDQGHFQGEFRINGRPVRAMVDTGATLVALNLSTAQGAGLKLTKASFRHEVQTANGLAKAAPAMIDTLQIGRITIKNVEAVVLEDGALNGVLIGMSFLRRLKRYEAQSQRLLMVQ